MICRKSPPGNLCEACRKINDKCHFQCRFVGIYNEDADPSVVKRMLIERAEYVRENNLGDQALLLLIPTDHYKNIPKELQDMYTMA